MERQTQTPQETPDDGLRTDAEIRRATDALAAYAERPGIGAERRNAARERIGEIAARIIDNPDRADGKTEHDIERAHLMALAANANESRLAKDRRGDGVLRKAFRTDRMHLNDSLGARLAEDMAAQVYDNDPIDAGPSTVDLYIERAKTKRPIYKTIK